MDPLKDRETKESGCSWQKSWLTFGCTGHKLMTLYVHTGTVREQAARQALLFDRGMEQFYYADTVTSTLLDGDRICQMLWIICQYEP